MGEPPDRSLDGACPYPPMLADPAETLAQALPKSPSSSWSAAIGDRDRPTEAGRDSGVSGCESGLVVGVYHLRTISRAGPGAVPGPADPLSTGTLSPRPLSVSRPP